MAIESVALHCSTAHLKQKRGERKRLGGEEEGEEKEERERKEERKERVGEGRRERMRKEGGKKATNNCRQVHGDK